MEFYQTNTLEDSFPDLPTALLMGYNDAMLQLHQDQCKAIYLVNLHDHF